MKAAQPPEMFFNAIKAMAKKMLAYPSFSKLKAEMRRTVKDGLKKVRKT